MHSSQNRPVTHRIAAILMTASLGLSGTAFAAAAPGFLRPLPDAPPPETAIVPDRKPTDAEIWGATSIEGTHFTAFGAKGSVGVGILFGPLGVAANIAKIAKVNRERALPLSDLVQTDVVQLLKTARQADIAENAAPVEMPAQTPAGRTYELVPVIQLNFDSDTAFNVTCVLNATLPTGGRKPWKGRYSVQMPGTYDTKAEGVQAAVKQVLPVCLSEANRLFTRHAKGGMVASDKPQPVPINGQLHPNYVIEAELPDRIIIPTIFGLMQMPPPPETQQPVS